ncbi:Acg family FMN-binding oxidoreductase [Fuscovulum ytuae]|uniref:Twin-arginine translocation pathway signal protein n=1 Tax=Fuscovulum ytuae TaxID=3042299 RepID=A0ABY8Q4Z9_9RHOB|nr:twin-arginine translocation pathway signal protein [Fuscovulum sp. YMD61]WGV15953.1 twin-arginine translocation pathway signal protein [Fuscovulum sp. YMD61]
MTLTRRKMIHLMGGGAILAAGAGFGFAATRNPQTAYLPWEMAGRYDDPRMRALSWALLAPNPHNRQPWLADLSEQGVITLYADLERMLPHTDPLHRQITIGLGCLLELLRMAAADDGHRAETTLFPQGSSPTALDTRPIARITLTADPSVARDPLFALVPQRRSNKEPFDLTRPIAPELLPEIAKAVQNGAAFGGTVDTAEVLDLRALTHEALRIEVETPHTFQESVDLFRIGHREVDANPDGIDFSGPLFETLRLTGQFSRESAADPTSFAFQSGLDAVFANTDTAMGHVWLVTKDNSRDTQIATGADWLRVNLAATARGLGFQPLSQALQEYPEMAALYAQVHERLAPDGGTVQMLARIGYGPTVGTSPRWPLESRIIHA